MLGHQFLSIIIIGAIAGLATLIADTIFYNIIVSFLTSGLIYIVFLMGILFIFPSLFSTNHNEIIQNIKLFKLKIISS